MSITAKPLTEPELIQRILEMGQTGVYRESILTTFAPYASKRQIRSAIAQAKQFGLHSVAALRDPELGTYYQAEPGRVEVFRHAIATTGPLTDAERAQRLIDSVHTIKVMLSIAGVGAVGLFGIGALCLLQGAPYTASVLWLMASLAASIWVVQNHVAQQVLR